MKSTTPKKLFAFILTVLVFSTMPILVNAQKKCLLGNCQKGFTCVDGICVKSGGGNGGGGGCNCNVRPIPYTCGQICGWKSSITNSGSKQTAISFSLDKPETVSAKIFDLTGRLVKILGDKKFAPGEHQLQWDATGVNPGIYIVQYNAGDYSETKKISVLN